MAIKHKTKQQNHNKAFLTVFALPFLGVGVWMLFSIITSIGSYISMQNWETVNAYVITGGYKTNYGSGNSSTTYEAYGTYRYTYKGREYTSERLSIKGGSDNMGDYQQNMGNRISRYVGSSRPIEAFVNPNNPNDAVIDRAIRWGTIGFKAIFVILFGGMGAGALIWARRTPKIKDLDLPIYKEKPWLANDKWQDGTIFSDAKIMIYFTWGFAIFWNAISSYLPFVIYNEVVNKENYPALVALMFPLVGVILLIWAIRTTLAWKKLGRSPVILDPFPGSIGGDVGGTIELNIPYDSNNKFIMKLASIHSYVSGRGDSRKRIDNILWQEKIIAHTETGIKGTRVSFKFDVPEGLIPSDAANRGRSYHIWRLNIHAKLKGADIDRNFDIPVYPTGEKTLRVSDRAVEFSETATLNMETKAVNKAINLTQGSYGPKLSYPIGRHLSNGVVGIIMGGVFAGIGSFIIMQESQYLFGGIFALIGSLIMIGAFYMCTNSLKVEKGGNNNIKVTRKILGITVKIHDLAISDITKITKNSILNSGDVKFFSIYAHNTYGSKVVLGEGFKGQGEADTAIDIIKNTFGIKIE